MLRVVSQSEMFSVANPALTVSEPLENISNKTPQKSSRARTFLGGQVVPETSANKLVN